MSKSKCVILVGKSLYSPRPTEKKTLKAAKRAAAKMSGNVFIMRVCGKKSSVLNCNAGVCTKSRVSKRAKAAWKKHLQA